MGSAGSKQIQDVGNVNNVSNVEETDKSAYNPKKFWSASTILLIGFGSIAGALTLWAVAYFTYYEIQFWRLRKGKLTTCSESLYNFAYDRTPKVGEWICDKNWNEYGGHSFEVKKVR